MEDTEQRRNDLLPELGRCRSCRRCCRSSHDKKLQCQKNVGWWAEKDERRMQSLQDKKQRSQKSMDGWAKIFEQLRNTIEESRAGTEDNGQKILAESLVEAELDLEISGLHARDGRSGSMHRSQTGCFEQQQISAIQVPALQGELSKRFAVQHQPAPVLRCMSPKGRRKMRKEKKTRRSRGNQRVEISDRQCQGFATKGFQLALFFDASMPPRNSAGESNGDEFNSLRGEMI